MSLHVITTTAEFETLATEWEGLNDEPLRSFDWHFAWWNHFGDDKELRIYCLRIDGKTIGIAPFFVDHWLGQSRIRFIGSGDTCTDYAQILCEEKYLARFIAAIDADLAEELEISMIELEGVTDNDSAPICNEFLATRYWKYSRDLEPTWVLDLPDSWDEFYQGSKKHLKRKIKKANSRLNSPEIKVESTDDGLDFETAFEILVELHQDRFESKGELGVFADQRFYDFLITAARKLYAKGKVEIVIASENGEPFIAQIYLKSQDGPQLYQAGIRSSKMHLEPGHLLLTYGIRRAIENGAAHFDFLRGDQPYKPYWGAKPRELYKTRLVSKKIFPSAVNRSYQFLRIVKNACTAFARATG